MIMNIKQRKIKIEPRIKLNYNINTNEIPNHFTFSCEKRDLLCNHRNSDLFTCEDNMLFSGVKISCFHVKAHLVLFSLAFI